MDVIARRPGRGLKTLVVAGLVAWGLLGWAGCSGDDGDVLAADALATAELEGLEETSTSTQDAGKADLKKTYPTLRRTFAVAQGLTDEQAIAIAADSAEESGWSIDFRSARAFTGSKALEGRPATAKAAVTDQTGDRLLTLVLTLR